MKTTTTISTISQDKLNEISKNIITSIEKFMEECSVSTAKSAVKFWLCTNPNPLLNKARNKVIKPPKSAVKAAEDLRKLIHTDELANEVKQHGFDVEFMVMYAIYDHFYGEGHDDITPGDRKGSIFNGGFTLDLFKAKATGNKITGNKIKRTW